MIIVHRKHTKISSTVAEIKDQEKYYQEIIENQRKEISELVSGKLNKQSFK